MKPNRLIGPPPLGAGAGRASHAARDAGSRPLGRLARLLVLGVAVLVAGCATREANVRLQHFDAGQGYQVGRKSESVEDRETLLVLAFSGGGTRAAAFSYGVLETLRDIELTTSSGRRVRGLDMVDIVTGISGGSFTALAYGLHGDRLFDVYEAGFLKRNVQGELLQRAANPVHWPLLASAGTGRSELAANLYDEILFNGATFASLKRDGPRILVGATDLADGTRLVFDPENFDVLCADLSKVRLARAAAASSAVPVVLSSITIDNFGGTCGYQPPAWTKLFLGNPDPPRPAARTVKRLRELEAFADRERRPYLHLVDGGVSDNLGMRGVLDALSNIEAMHEAGVPTPFDHVRNIYIFVVNSLATPPNDWNLRESPPGLLDVLLKATGTPIDRYSYETVETLRDIQARWATLRTVQEVIAPYPEISAKLERIRRAPQMNIHVVDVSFAVLPDKADRDYLNALPTSFVLDDEAVDRLRLGAKNAILASPEIRRLIDDGRLRMVGPGPRSGAAGPAKDGVPPQR